MIDNRESLISDVLKHADIVKVISSYIKVNKKGKNYTAICPFHDDSNPSLMISSEKQIFKCFVCGTAGNAISFVEKYEHISFFEALKKVAEICNYSDPRLERKEKAKPKDVTKEPLYKCLEDLCSLYQYALSTDEGKKGLDYFLKRNLDEKFQTKYLLGYSFENGSETCSFLQKKGHSLKTIEDTGIANLINGKLQDKNRGRAIFPICDFEGRVVGFSARKIDDKLNEPKYINSPETPIFHKASILYNYHIAKEKAKIEGYVYVLEGFMDVYALDKIGIQSAVALMGTALSEEHIKMLRMLGVEVRLCLDGDNPGQQAMMKAANQLSKAGIQFRVVNSNGNLKDPDEIFNEDGPDALRVYLNNLYDRVDFALSYYQKTNPLKTIQEKKKIVEFFIPILSNVSDSLEFDSYLRKLANVTGFEIESLRDLMQKAKKEKTVLTPIQLIKQFQPEKKDLMRLELAEREILYQMLKNNSAIEFYETKMDGFYDEIYRSIANFLVDYAKNNKSIEINDLISKFEISDIDNKDELIEKLTEIYFEKYHPENCNENLLNDYLNTINEEKQKIFESDLLQQALQGKSPLEQARIISNFNRKRILKEKEKMKNGN